MNQVIVSGKSKLAKIEERFVQFGGKLEGETKKVITIACYGEN